MKVTMGEAVAFPESIHAYRAVPARKSAAGIMFACGLALGSGADAVRPVTPPPSAERGQMAYQKSCAVCHGYGGDGKGAFAPNLSPKPRDFTSGMYKFRTTGSGELPTDADLMRSIEDGIHGTQMPAWKGVLSYQERADVIAYIKTFSADFRTPPPPTLAFPPPPAAVADDKEVAEGRMVYMLMECWACHGGKGKGDGKSGRTLKDDWGYKILPWDLTNQAYKGGNDPQSLYRTFSTGLNGTPMPAYALDGFLVGGDAAVDPAKYQEAYGPAEVETLKAWLRAQPTDGQIQRMDAERKSELGERRKWALVAYIRSLVRTPNFFVRMFTGNPELTP